MKTKTLNMSVHEICERAAMFVHKTSDHARDMACEEYCQKRFGKVPVPVKMQRKHGEEIVPVEYVVDENSCKADYDDD